MTAPTRGPLAPIQMRCRVRGSGRNLRYVIETEGGHEICERGPSMEDHGPCESESSAMSELVRRWNAHAALLASRDALAKALEHTEAALSAAIDAIGRPVPNVWNAAQREARSALAAVKGAT